MKIKIDIQSSVTQQAGVGRYTRELVENLGATTPTEDLQLVYFDFRGKALPFGVPNARLKPICWVPGRFAQFGWKTMRFPPYNWLAGNADLFHFPNFVIPPLTRGKAVVTIHDLSFLRFPQFAESRNARFLNRKIHDTAARADAIITISNFSAQEVATYLKVAPDRIFPIHLGVDSRFHRPDADRVTAFRKKQGLDRPYLLTVGTLEPRKNIPHLVRVFEAMHDFDGELVIAGGKGWKVEPILECIRTSPRADAIRLLGYTDEEDLPALYAGADIFLLASFYEGFGLPPLEAMACGTPVVSSAGGSLAEVLGQGAVCLEHYDVEGWTEAIHQVLHDADYREALQARGQVQAASYTWRDTALKSLDVYRQVTA